MSPGLRRATNRRLGNIAMSDTENSVNGEAEVVQPDEARTRAKLLGRLKEADRSVRCAHIKSNNLRRGSPAMKGDGFCHFHSEARKLRDAEQAAAKATEMPVLENPHALQLAIMKVVALLANNKIDEKTARAIFEGLRLAQKTLNECILDLH